VSRLLCLQFLLGNSPPQTLLLAFNEPLGGEGKATWRGEKGKRKERKGKGAPRKKILRATSLQFITKLVDRWTASHRNGCSSFRISLRLYYSNKKFSLKVKTTEVSLESCCPVSNFSGDCYGDQSVFMVTPSQNRSRKGLLARLARP